MSCSLLDVRTGAGGSGRAKALHPTDDDASDVLPVVIFVSSLWFGEATSPFFSEVVSAACLYLEFL